MQRPKFLCALGWGLFVVLAAPVSAEPLKSFPVCKLVGYWDGYKTPQDAPANLYKGYLGDIMQDGLDRGNHLAVMVSGFQPDFQEWEIRQRFKNQAPFLKKKVAENTKLIIIQDEPRHKGFKPDVLETMVEIAREEMGSEFKYGYSHMRYHAQNSELPTNVDVVGINFYPFYYKEYAKRYGDAWEKMYITTKEHFMSFLEEVVTNVRKEVPGAEIVLVGQAFYTEDKYRKPPVDSPLWYAEFARDNPDVIGILWYEWDDRRGKEKGTQSMPDLYEKQKEAFEMLTAGCE